MARRVPIIEPDIIGQLNLEPEKCVNEYLEAKQNERANKAAPLLKQTGNGSIEEIFIANTNEYERMVKAQRQMLQQGENQAALNIKRTRKMYKAQERLRARLISVNNFLKECNDKKVEAEKSIEEEIKRHEKLRKDTKEFQNSIAELTSFREVLKRTVRIFKPYERILKEVVQKSDMYISTKDCMDRCDALMLAQVEIDKYSTLKLIEIDKMRSRMIQLTKDAASIILGLKTDLAYMERSYNNARNNCYKWEKLYAKVKDVINRNDMEKELTLDALHTLYQLLCTRRNESLQFERNDVSNIVDYIDNEFLIINHVQRRMEEKKRTSEDLKIENVAYC